MRKNNHIANAVIATDGKAKFDAMVKELLSDKQILAWILRDTMEEFKGMTIREIVSCIEGEPKVAKVPIAPGLRTETVMGLRNEQRVPNEGMITYDIYFYVRTPDGERTKIFINVEAQKKYNPGYDLVTRAVFYCARMLSVQMDTEFTAADYDNIKKVCSIWICMDSPDYAAETITRYSIHPEQLYGEFKGKARYDLISAVMVCLAKEGKEKNGSELHRMLETLLAHDISAEEKLTALTENFGIETSSEMKAEVREMCNLSDRIEEQGIEKGIDQLVLKMIRKGASDEQIQEMTDLPMERIAKLRKKEKDKA